MKYVSPFPDRRHIILHHGCPDGFCGALVLSKALAFESSVSYVNTIPVQYGQPLPYGLEANDCVILVDFSYPRDMMVELCKQVAYVVVLDHHKTAKDELAMLKLTDVNNIAIFFDMERSGARMAWDFLECLRTNTKENVESILQLEILPKQSVADTPEFILYIEDRDLRKFELPHSREISAYVRSLPYKEEWWLPLLPQLAWERNFDLYRHEGQAILRFQKQQVNLTADHAVDINFPLRPRSNEFMQVKIVNTTTNISEVAEELYTRYELPFTVTWFYGEQFIYSLRSNRGVDVSKIAKAYGGGGHPAAAEFVSDTMIKGIE